MGEFGKGLIWHREATIDAKAFLGSVGAGRSITQAREGQELFAQGDPADALFLYPERKGVLAQIWSDRVGCAVVNAGAKMHRRAGAKMHHGGCLRSAFQFDW